MRIAREALSLRQSRQEDEPLTDGLIPPRDYTGLGRQDAQLRIWLPDQARLALSEVCSRAGVSMTVYLTELFATYLFGIHEVMQMQEHGTGLYAETEEADADMEWNVLGEPDELGPEFDEPPPEIGKNIFALKIFLPNMIKLGMQARAEYAGVPLGRFARAMICAHLFGRDIGPVRLLSHGN